MSDTYTINQKILLDGKSIIVTANNLTYPGTYNFYRTELTIPANTEFFNISLEGKVNIQRIHLDLLDKAEGYITAYLNENTFAFKVNPSFVISFHPELLTVSNTASTAKTIEVIILSE